MLKSRLSPLATIHLLGMGTAISLLGDATIYTVLPHPNIAAQVGVTLSMVGLLLGANRLVRLVLNGPVGLLYDRLPRRGFLIAALALGAGSSIFYAEGYGFWPLLLGRVLWGLAWSLLWVGGNSVVLDVSTEQNRGRYSGIYQMWFFIGVAMASFVGALLTDLVGFRTGQWISVFVIALMALTWYLFLPETHRGKLQNPDQRSELNNSTWRLLPWRVLMGTFVTVFVARFVAWGILAATSILWLSALFGDGLQSFELFIPIATLTGLFSALSNLTSIGGARLAGWVSDWLGRRWPVIGVGMLLGGLGLWLMGGSIVAVALAGAFLVPLSGSTAETLIPAIAGDRITPDLRSRALGLINTAGDFGATVGPFIALGALNAGWISIGEIFKTSAVLFSLVAILAFRLAALKGGVKPQSS